MFQPIKKQNENNKLSKKRILVYLFKIAINVRNENVDYHRL